MATEKTEDIKKEAPSKKTAEKKVEKTANATSTVMVAVPLLNIREKASITSDIKGTLIEGEKVTISIRTPQGFGKLDDGRGYIKLEFTEKLQETDEPL